MSFVLTSGFVVFYGVAIACAIVTISQISRKTHSYVVYTLNSETARFTADVQYDADLRMCTIPDKPNVWIGAYAGAVSL